MVEEMPLKVVLYPDTSKLEGAIGKLGVGAGGKGGVGVGGALAAGAAGGAVAGAIIMGLDKLVKKMTEASGILKGSLHILSKSFTMFIRPFADFLGMLLRPLAIALLKVAVLWYKWLSNILIKTKTERDIEAGGVPALLDVMAESGKDVIEGNKTMGEHLRTTGEALAGLVPETGIDPLDALINGLIKFVADLFGAVVDFHLWLGKMGVELGLAFLDAIATGVQFLYEIGQKVWDLLAPVLEEGFALLIDFGKWVWDSVTGALGNIASFLKGFGTWVWEQLLEAIGTIGDVVGGGVEFATWLWDEITTALGNLPDILGGLATWVWDALTAALKDVVNAIIGAANSIIRWLKSIDVMGFAPFQWMSELPTLQRGGRVEETGVAVVHKGETVVPAGVSAGGNTFNFYNSRITSESEARELMEEAFAQVNRRVRT